MTTRARIAGWMFPLLTLAGCGYVGDPQPPLVNIPSVVTDLRAIQRGAMLVVEFTAPELTTEGMVISRPVSYDLRVGKAEGDRFEAGPWSASARAYPAPASGPVVRVEVPAGPWVSQDVFLAVRAIGHNQRDAGWSNAVRLRVVAPPGKPAGLRAESIAEGVRLTWKGAGAQYRVFRLDGNAEEPSQVAVAPSDSYVDAAVTPGNRYRYRVQASQPAGSGEAESEPSDLVEVVARDVSPPKAPSGLRLVTGLQTIELGWDPAREEDFATYRVYRGINGGPIERLAESAAPAYSDRAIEPGKRYRYAITAIDQAGNESARSEPAEVTAP
ncbi:MAG: fibronectin type III domain-containing protein [Bryobacteraceae bacterium]